VFAPISAIFAILLSTTTLPNGIRLIELASPPGNSESAEIVAGYDEAELNGLASIAALRPLIFNAYAAGGNVQMIHEQDRTAVRFTIPRWALPMLADRQLASLFKEAPAGTEGADAPVPDFRAKVEEEIRSALLGADSKPGDYATDDAFIAISGPIPGALRDALAAIPRRGASRRSDEQNARLPAERTLRFKSDLQAGAVIFAAPAPTVYYREWYVLLLLDRAIHQTVPALKTTLLPALRPYYYRMELPLAAGQFPEPAEENLMQELQRLQLTPVSAQQLLTARQQALAYLDSKEIRDWFASRGIPERLEEGIQWVQGLSTDDLRMAARDLLLMNRVVATWAPKPKQTTVEVESLNASSSQPSPSGRGRRAAPGEGPSLPRSPFPTHKDPAQNVAVPEKLPSGVSLALSNVHAVFVSGGALTKYDREPDAAIMKSFEKYRADRILVLAPAGALDRARELWSSFKGSDGREAAVPKGPVSSGDLPAVYVLKTILELKAIEAGMWPGVDLRIDASEGAAMQIGGDADRRQQIIEWAKSIGKQGPPEKDFAWMREVAVHRFDSVRADLQALTWERDPQGTIQDIETILPKFVQDVAQIYF
jgi:hypothetical protein